MRNILVAVDRSKASRRCLDFAIDNIYRPGDVIHLLHVVPLGTENIFPLAFDASIMVDVGVGAEQPNAEKQKAIDEDAKKYLLSNFVPALEGANVPYQIEVARFQTDSDSVGSVLCNRAEALEAVALVMARHNKGTLTELFVGSATKYCSHHCKQPLVIIHDE